MNEHNKEIKKKWNDEHSKEYYIKNKERIDANNKEYRNKNKDIIREKRVKNYYKVNERRKNRRYNEPLYKLINNIRTSISGSINKNGYKKSSRTHEILGCSFKCFKSYIEGQMEDWMNWDNHGKYNGELNYGWDLDHITPSSSAKTEEDVIKLNHYSNFQPLCSKVNRDIKRNKIS